MGTILNAVIFTLGQGFAFNIVLPIWYVIMQVFGVI